VTASATQVVIDFILSLGWDARPELGYPVFPGPEILASPDQAVFVTGSGGPGYTTEEPATDAGIVQLRLRGPSDDPFTPEAVFGQLDSMILRASFPVVIDGVTVVHMHRADNGPSPLPLDPGDRRFEYTCNYIVVTGV
jgi:hypothetical protein